MKNGTLSDLALEAHPAAVLLDDALGEGEPQADPFALLSEDGEHPNHAGYALMAETWNRALKRVY